MSDGRVFTGQGGKVHIPAAERAQYEMCDLLHLGSDLFKNGMIIRRSHRKCGTLGGGSAVGGPITTMSGGGCPGGARTGKPEDRDR